MIGRDVFGSLFVGAECGVGLAVIQERVGWPFLGIA